MNTEDKITAPSCGRPWMIALNVLDIKPFMKHFLVGNTFDAFDLSEGSVTTFCTFSIDGTYMKDFDDSDGENEDPGRACIPWARVREHVFSLMRGKRTPLAFKFVFMLSKKAVPRFLEKAGIAMDASEVSGLFLNVSFRSRKLMITTGTSLKMFTMDRTVDNAWDSYVQSFLKSRGIAAEKA